MLVRKPYFQAFKQALIHVIPRGGSPAMALSLFSITLWWGNHILVNSYRNSSVLGLSKRVFQPLSNAVLTGEFHHFILKICPTHYSSTTSHDPSILLAMCCALHSMLSASLSLSFLSLAHGSTLSILDLLWEPFTGYLSMNGRLSRNGYLAATSLLLLVVTSC